MTNSLPDLILNLIKSKLRILSPLTEYHRYPRHTHDSICTYMYIHKHAHTCKPPLSPYFLLSLNTIATPVMSMIAQHVNPSAYIVYTYTHTVDGRGNDDWDSSSDPWSRRTRRGRILHSVDTTTRFSIDIKAPWIPATLLLTIISWEAQWEKSFLTDLDTPSLWRSNRTV